jgi:hypothetical protein
MSFSDFKKRSQGSLESLQKQMEEGETKKSYKDDRFWRPELDKSGNGFAVIRFLPASDGEDIPWAKVYNHGFKGPGGWYIENSLTTIGQKDPVSEMNSRLWNSGIESDKDIARDRKRRLNYISNILVVSDPSNPENEGKVFLFKYGKKIFDKIQEAMNPEFQDEEKVNPFDYWGGANFKLKVRKVSGFVNYDKSEFESVSPLLGGDDEKLERLWKTQYKLSEFTDAKNFKSYDELKARLDEVLMGDERGVATAENDTVHNDDTPSISHTRVSEEEESLDSFDEGADAMSYFKQLASED